MNELIICIFVLQFMVDVIHGQAQTNKTVTPAGKPRTSTSLIDTALKFLGISDSPGTLKGPGDEVTSGELWLADLDSRSTRALTSSVGYRSPVFLPGSDDILALQGADVVRVPSRGGEGKKLYFVDDIVKLVGAAGRDDPEKILILLRGEDDGHPRVGILTVSTGAVTVVPYDLASSQDLQMVENLQGWSRMYGDRRIYVDRQTKHALSGSVEWSDVFLKVDNQDPVDISQGDGVNCGQPSLSETGHLLVFVKAEAQ
jgi:hypothetical protein